MRVGNLNEASSLFSTGDVISRVQVTLRLTVHTYREANSAYIR